MVLSFLTFTAFIQERKPFQDSCYGAQDADRSRARASRGFKRWTMQQLQEPTH